jgi:hypothetical protein
MGFHYVSGAALADGKLDPARPEILLYAPGPSGPVLIGAEYFKPDADQDLQTDNDRPTLFGRAFDGPMLGHTPTMPKHYDLHGWFFTRNPSGMFAVWNPDVPAVRRLKSAETGECPSPRHALSERRLGGSPLSAAP